MVVAGLVGEHAFERLRSRETSPAHPEQQRHEAIVALHPSSMTAQFSVALCDELGIFPRSWIQEWIGVEGHKYISCTWTLHGGSQGQADFVLIKPWPVVGIAAARTRPLRKHLTALRREKNTLRGRRAGWRQPRSIGGYMA